MATETQTAESDVLTKWATKRPFIISGPCSAESEEQVLRAAKELATTKKVDVLRAGIWKPRTKPGSFEGVGVVGLPWLIRARQETGLPVAIEVANAKHVENALEFGIDVLWIGARTTTNPFSVQEVCDALKGTDVPVFIKNPINPDVELWSGGVERLKKAGVKHIGIIHRGFSNYGNTEFRNAPMWRLAIEMKRRYPDLLLICDPSHICGNRVGLHAVAQKSIDLGFGGLIIESHPDPDNAWSDAKQQITPARLAELLDSLVWRSEDSKEEEFLNALSKLREQINQIDDELLVLISQRMKIADEIGRYKKENKITILQTSRWNAILEKASKRGEKLNLSRDFITKYLDAIHMESISHQNKIMNEE